MKTKAVFLDRDGVLNHDPGYIGKIQDFHLIVGAAAAVKRLNDAGFRVIVISNQSGVGRGYFSEQDLAVVTEHLHKELAASGAKLDAIYYCPHAPGKDDNPDCECRKPKLGLIRQAESRFGLDLKRCFFVGDTSLDIRLAKLAGCASILVLTGKAGKDGAFPDAPDHTAADLSSAADWILAQS